MTTTTITEDMNMTTTNGDTTMTKTKQELREALRLAAAAAEQAKDRDAVLNDAERAARRAYYAVIEAEIAAEKREPTTHRFADESGFGVTETS